MVPFCRERAVNTDQRRIQGDFDTGIPVWAPKLWRPKKGFLKFSRNS